MPGFFMISLLRYNPFPLSVFTFLARGSMDPTICATLPVGYFGIVLPEHIVSLSLSLNFFENAVKLCNTDSRREGVRYEVALVSPPCSWATPLSEATFWGFQFLTNVWDSI